MGGTTIKPGLFTRDGRLGVAPRVSLDRTSPDAAVACVLHAVTDVVRFGTQRCGVPPVALGLAVLGIVDDTDGVARYSAATGWRDVPLRELVARRTGLPVALSQDLRAAALAETRHRGLQEAASVLFVAVGTGVAVTQVVHGRVVTGAHHAAGELGHLQVDPAGRDCPCGATGCLETVASAAAVERAYREVTGLSLTAADVAARVGRGDAVAEQVWAAAVQALATGLAAAITVVDPATIVVGGGLALAGEVLLKPLRTDLARRYHLGPIPDVDAAQLGDTAALQGAALLAWQTADALQDQQ